MRHAEGLVDSAPPGDKDMANIGKALQSTTMSALKSLASRIPLYVHRLEDTHAARNFLPTTPGDFLVVYNGIAYLIECKSSEQEDVDFGSRFRSLVPNTQIASARLWIRAGGESLFLFHSIPHDLYAVYAGKVVVSMYQNKRQRIDPLLGPIIGKSGLEDMLLNTLWR